MTDTSLQIIKSINKDDDQTKKKSSSSSISSHTNLTDIPDSILNDAEINQWVKVLPQNYTFEVHKTIHRIRQSEARSVALQFPEGLLLFACSISDIIKKFCATVSQVIIMGDVTYGACCIDDYTAKALDCDFMVHYAHSCLVPVSKCKLNNILYVFVDIKIDLVHLIETLKYNFSSESKLLLISTIQFVSSLRFLFNELKSHFANLTVPQILPLSKGEILGCTSPAVSGVPSKDTNNNGDNDYDALVYVGDGRFHLESIMIHNPRIKAYKYDPYSKKFTVEKYDHIAMYKLRYDAIKIGKEAKRFGVILGTLGRQGDVDLLNRLKEVLRQNGKKHMVLLLSEIFPAKLSMFSNTIDCWVQVACPRLSIDWGYAFQKPLLTPYELFLAFETPKEEIPSDSVQTKQSKAIGKNAIEDSKSWIGFVEKYIAGKEHMNEQERNELEKKLEEEKVFYSMDFYSSNNDKPWTVNYNRRLGAKGKSAIPADGETTALTKQQKKMLMKKRMQQYKQKKKQESQT